MSAQPVNLRVMRIYDSGDAWLGELARSGKRPRTLVAYKRLIHGLGDMYPHHDINEVTTAMFRRYLDTVTMSKGIPLDQDTISQRIGTLKRFFAWNRQEGIIEHDPAERVQGPRRKNPLENDKIIMVSTAETMRMLAVARADLGTQVTPQHRYRKLLALAGLAYTGSRRHAFAQAKITDCDLLAEPPMITYHEKGGKTIKKPIPARFAAVIREAWMAGVWQDDPHNPDGYLVPPRAIPRVKERDDRIIYALVKEVAHDAGVTAHVHSLRAAFAVFFLEQNPTETYALKDLLGHSQMATTEIYLRRLNRQKGMAVVVDLDWGEPTDRGGSPGQFAAPTASDAQHAAEPVPRGEQS